MKEVKEVRIVVLHSGFVLVGYYKEQGSKVYISCGRIIQDAGTTKGFAELRHGPLTNTILQDPAKYEHHILAEVHTLICSEKGQKEWPKHLNEKEV